MRILIATYGSLGDLHPALALGHALQARGHEAVIATSEPYRDKVAAHGLAFAPLRPNLSLDNPELVRRVMDGRRGSEFLLRKLVYPNIRDMFADLLAAARGADVLVGAELACAMPLVAARLGRPWAFFALSPISFLSVHDPVVLPGPAFLHRLQSCGPRAGRAVMAVARAASYSWWAPVRRFRRELGLPAGDSPLFSGKYSPHLNLALFSAAIQPPQPDWPARTLQAGFPFFDEVAPAVAPPPLPAPVAAFLAAGTPPIVFTLGSAAVQFAGDFYRHSAEAAVTLGRRALLLLGSNPPPAALPPSVLAWDYLPYARVFPHAAAVVHQGGIGTTAQVLRAGRPMLVVPFAHDQFDNAYRVRRLGVAAELRRHRYSPATAAAALRELLDNPAVADRASSLAAAVAADPGLPAVCAALEAFNSPKRPGGT